MELSQAKVDSPYRMQVKASFSEVKLLDIFSSYHSNVYLDEHYDLSVHL